MDDGPDDIAGALEAIGRIEAVPTLLAVLCGLHICSQIVRAHKGSISVTSSQEDGTRFTARLPLGVSQRINSSISTTAPDGNQRGFANQRASREAVVHIPS
jgi:hypothetical protein